MEFEEIVKGLAEALELERELGVRSVEIDRSLLVVGAVSHGDAVSHRVKKRDDLSASDAERLRVPKMDDVAASDAERLRVPTGARQETRDAKIKVVFLHDKALSAKGVEMMAKIVTAMHLTPETAPILFTGTLPPARAYVVLGHNALKKWFPGQAGAPGQWIAPTGERNVLVTYSPEYILRFGTVTPAVKKLKMDMWTSLKSVMQRIDSSR